MNRFRSLLSARVLVPVFALAIAGVAYVSTLPRTEAGLSVCTYYSDATHKHAVGARGTGCCGAVINWGDTSPYKVCQPIFCTDQICPN